MTDSGKRYEIILLEIGRNSEGAKRELFQLQEYFKKKKGENYTVRFTTYGRANKILPRLIEYYLKHPLIDKNSAEKLFIGINDLFVQNKIIGTFGIIATAAIAEGHRLFKKKGVEEIEKPD